MIEALLWVLSGYVRGCHAVSRGLQRAFVVNKWAVGLGAYALGWVLWLLQAPSWSGLVFLLFWCAYCLYMERATLAWCWAGLRARTGRTPMARFPPRSRGASTSR